MVDIVADTGTFSSSGDSALLYDRVSPVDAGSFSFAGMEGILSVHKVLQGSQGPYSINTSDVDLLMDYCLYASSGAISISDVEINLTEFGNEDKLPYEEDSSDYDPEELPYKKVNEYVVNVS